MNSITQKSINYLKSHTFKKHKSGNYGMYGLNFLGGDPVIKIDGDLWKFLWWETGSDKATFINAKGIYYTFTPSTIYYSDKRNDIVRMEEAPIQDDITDIFIGLN
jgi:hypothetical protein